MEDIEARLKESTEACLERYEKWNTDSSGSEEREALQEAIHDLRKVTSRLEIEIAIKERKKVTNKPLPIPPHRSSEKGAANVESILPDNGNTDPEKVKSANGKSSGGARRPKTRRPAQRNKSKSD